MKRMAGDEDHLREITVMHVIWLETYPRSITWDHRRWLKRQRIK